MRIYASGSNEEYTVSMVKQSCEEFSTLTYEQAMRVCELLAKYAGSNKFSDEIESLQDENSELESELENAQDELEDEVHKNWKLQERIDELENEIEVLKNASNK